MPYCNKTALEYLQNFSSDPQAPVKAITCAYSSDGGAGMGLPVFALILFGGVGLAMTVRTGHPAPLVVAGMLSAGAVAFAIPGMAAKIMTLVIFFAVAGLGMYLYRRAQTSL